jgi:hypothetical protein
VDIVKVVNSETAKGQGSLAITSDSNPFPQDDGVYTIDDEVVLRAHYRLNVVGETQQAGAVHGKT